MNYQHSEDFNLLSCCRIVCEDTWQLHLRSGKESKKRIFWTEGRSRNCLTVVLFLATLLSALYVPTMGSVIALLGGSSALFIFIFPGLAGDFFISHFSVLINICFIKVYDKYSRYPFKFPFTTFKTKCECLINLQFNFQNKI